MKDIRCPKCGAGMFLKQARLGKLFWICGNSQNCSGVRSFAASTEFMKPGLPKKRKGGK
jgi:ssDNA-binding Zn-finger/Zn-ribbon topoisomerase 1